MRYITILNLIGLAKFHKHKFKLKKQKKEFEKDAQLYIVWCPVCELVISTNEPYNKARVRTKRLNKSKWRYNNASNCR